MLVIQRQQCLKEVKEKLDIPVLGVILPGSSAAIKSTRNGKIGVIGTPMTINSEVYPEKIKSLSPKMEVSGLACPNSFQLLNQTK